MVPLLSDTFNPIPNEMNSLVAAECEPIRSLWLPRTIDHEFVAVKSTIILMCGYLFKSSFVAMASASKEISPDGQSTGTTTFS